MKKLLFILITALIMFGCESITPPDDPKFFTDITYEVTSTGDALTPDITYGNWLYSDPNNPNLLVWHNLRAEDATLPWTQTLNTCKGHPVSMGAIVTGNNRTMTFNIYDKNVLVATKTFVSNGFLWGGNLEYDIPKP